MASPWWIWIVVFGPAVICPLGAMIAGRIASNRSGLDKEEMAIVRRAARVGGGELVGRTLGYGVLAALQVPPPSICEPSGTPSSAPPPRKSSAPTRKNRTARTVSSFGFYELRLTRTELIKGYEENAQRIPLRGLTATVTTGQTVYITIEGPDTKFVYRNAFDAESNLRRAQQFAALLNYEASLQGAPL